MITRAVFVCLSALLMACSIMALRANCETLVVTAIKIRSSYDDSTLGKGESDGELLLSPSVRYDWKTEKTRVVIYSSLDAYAYAQHDEYRRENARLSGNFSYQLSERLLVRSALGWSRDHTVENEYEDSGLLAEKIARNTWSLSPGVTYSLTERDQIDIDASLAWVDSELSGYTDYSTLGASMGWSHALADGRLKVISQVDAQHYDFYRTDGSTVQNVLSLQAGCAWEYSELLTLKAMGGLSRTSTEISYDNYSFLNREDSAVTYLGSLSAIWTDEIWRMTVTADRAESPSSYGELVTRNRMRFSFGRSLSERLRTDLNGAVYLSETSGYSRRSESRTWNLGPTVNYALSEDSSMQAGYTYILEENILTDTTTDRHRAFVQFMMQFPEEW